MVGYPESLTDPSYQGQILVLSYEMASTGEVACLGDDFEEAFLKALLSVGYRVPVRNILLSTGLVESKAAFLECSMRLESMGMNLYAWMTCRCRAGRNIRCQQNRPPWN